MIVLTFSLLGNLTEYSTGTAHLVLIQRLTKHSTSASVQYNEILLVLIPK